MSWLTQYAQGILGQDTDPQHSWRSLWVCFRYKTAFHVEMKTVVLTTRSCHPDLPGLDLQLDVIRNGDVLRGLHQLHGACLASDTVPANGRGLST